MHYRCVVTREGQFTLAEFPDCPGCQTFVKGRANIAVAAREALEGWLEANLGRDLVPTKPGTVGIPRSAKVIEIGVPMPLAFRLELRWKRAQAKKTQAEFGKLLGMSQQQYAKLEGPRSNPTLETVQRIADRSGLGFFD
jgi:DNA-binding XRE family transcriptional regulator/predicted RNase H-like HicB family nuclease